MKTCLLIHMWATIPWHLHVKTTVCSVFIFAEHEFCKNSTNIFIRLMRWRMKTHVRSIFFSVDKWLKFFSLLNCKYGPIKQHIEFPLFLLHFLNRSSMRRAAVNFICTSIELLYIYRCAHNTKYKLVNRIFWTVRGSSWMWGYWLRYFRLLAFADSQFTKFQSHIDGEKNESSTFFGTKTKLSVKIVRSIKFAYMFPALPLIVPVMAGRKNTVHFAYYP